MNAVDEPSTSSVTTPPPMCSSSYSSMLCRPVKRIVSQNRRRFQQDGFDLDLTYITDRIIAMGYPSPSDTKESLYRNSMEHTVQFLDTYHPGHYKVFNLRGQFVYDVRRFHGRVESFEMTDHHPPRLELMAPFCRKVHEWLGQDPKNVVAVHCKAGKGRTGVMICAYLTYINFYPSPRQNMDYYSCVRTLNNKGVTIPSQRRYVYYFSHLRRNHLNYFPLRIQLLGVYVERPPKISSRTTRGGLWLRVSNVDVAVMTGDPIWISAEESEQEDQLRRGQPLTRGPDHYDPTHPTDNQSAANCISRRCYGWTVPESKPVFLEGDVRLDLYQKTTLLGVTAKDRGKLGHIWFNTMFCCHGFCGQVFVHGDEAHPYPATAAPPPHGGGSAATTPSVGTKETRSRARNGRTTSNGVKKIGSVDDSGAHQVNKSNGEKQTPRRAASAVSTPRSSKDGKIGESDPASMTPALTPPGQAQHCPDPNVIYGHNLAPRYRIQQQLLAAHNAGLLRDTYNERRQSESQPASGYLLPKAPVGRPAHGGPVSIERQPDEHVSTFSVLEIDRACKNKNLDTSFKVHIITRCIDPSDEEMKRTSEAFVSETMQRQKMVDDKRSEQLAHRQRRLDSSSSDKDSSKDSATVGPVVSLSAEGAEEPMQWEDDDERRQDSRYERFFFRQRADSHSTHPPVRYQCPLLSAATPRQEKSNSPMREEERATVSQDGARFADGRGDSFDRTPTASTIDARANATKAAPVHRPTMPPSGAGGDTPRSSDQRCHADVDLNEPSSTTSSDSCTDESNSIKTDAESTDVEEVTTTAL